MVVLLALATIATALGHCLPAGFRSRNIAGMVLITMSIASAFTFFACRHTKFSPRLGLASGLLSLPFGVLLVYQKVLGSLNG
jgi:hypothetical protein